MTLTNVTRAQTLKKSRPVLSQFYYQRMPHRYRQLRRHPCDLDVLLHAGNVIHLLFVNHMFQVTDVMTTRTALSLRMVSVSVLLSGVGLNYSTSAPEGLHIAGQNSDLIMLRRDAQSLIYVLQKREVICWVCRVSLSLLSGNRVTES